MNYLSKLFVIALMCISAHISAQKISVIPEPVQLTKGSGEFELKSNTPIVTASSNAEVQKVGEYLIGELKTPTGFSITSQQSGKNGITLALNSKQDARLGAEGYTLDVTPQDVIIKANTAAGLFYGVQTLLQLLPNKVESKNTVTNIRWTIPAVNIVDYPRFGWRGLMLDVSRHFFPKEYIKSYLDEMARYKLNRFHWHLTDDNGWRVEIKSLPKLTEIGSWRVPRVGTFGSNDAPKPGEKPTDGGFYTQDDIREIVQYAKNLHIEILPEIDVPGHSMAAIAAYPDLCVTKDTSIKVNPGSNFATWESGGKFTMHVDNTVNPASDYSYQFLDKVFTEIATLFPFEYVHIGGDECYKGFWERDPGVQAFMKKNNIKDGVSLQSYFTKRLSQIIIAKKKKVIGWDEILEGGIAPGAAVMSWRGTKGGIEAAHQKHQFVMSPAPMYYLDMNQGERSIEPPIYGDARLKDAYSHEPLPAGIDSTLMLGAQGNLWTEQVPTTYQSDYMTYPRAFAMAESFWSPRNRKNWNTFTQKVEDHFERADIAGVNYATSIYDPIIKVTKNADGQLMITLDKEVPSLEIHYTYDNTIPNKYSPVYSEQFVFPEGADSFKVQSYRDGKPLGRLIIFKTEDLAKRVTKN